MPVIEMDVDATTLWVNTGLTLDGTSPVSVEVTSGTWTANPANGLVDADGHQGLVAKPGYNLPGELEGLLVARIGDTVFAIGKSRSIETPPSGLLSLSINDDMYGRYGIGFPDNQGTVAVRIAYGVQTSVAQRSKIG